MEEPPPLHSLTLRLVAFVAHRPSVAIAQAVRHTGSGASVFVLAPPSERDRVLAMGAQWSNMTAAAATTLAWAERYRHSSGNPRGYELFCLQRWLMLWEALRPMNLAPDAAIAVLDDDMLLYRSAAMWLRELGASQLHASSQTVGVMGVAFQLHSPGTLRRFSEFLRWLYGLPTSKLAREVERYGVSRPLDALTVRVRHTLAHGLVVYANRTHPGTYKHFSDVQAMDAFCRHSAEGKLSAMGRARCSIMEHERQRIHGNAPPYADQPTNCSALYLAPVAPGSVLQFHVMAQPAPLHVVGTPHTPGPSSANASAASRWASALRWKAATPFAPDRRGRLYGLCLAHLQGPRAKEMFMDALTAPSRRGRHALLGATSSTATAAAVPTRRGQPTVSAARLQQSQTKRAWSKMEGRAAGSGPLISSSRHGARLAGV